MVFITAMEKRKLFSLLLWRQRMVFTTATDTRNGFHYCYGDKESFSLLLWRKKMVFTTTMEKKQSFSLLLWTQGMAFTTAMETWNGFHYCYGDEEWCSLLISRQGIAFI